ncbi:MAG: alpha/beta fold hydrolase [Myxococcaceae bacterium]
MIQSADTYTLPAAHPLEEGGLLVNASIAYESYGELAGDNSILLLHDLTRSHRALCVEEGAAFQPSGWGGGLIGPDGVLNPEISYLVSPNLLGSPFGSTSPVSRVAGAAKPLGPAFPALAIEDMARGVAALLRGLKIRRAKAVVGVGLGGMVALRAAALFPELVGAVITLGTAKSLTEGLREQLGFAGQLLRADPGYQGGEYPPGGGPRRTMKKLRIEHLRRVYSRDYLAAEFADLFAAERHLEAEAEAFSETFDANCYAQLCAAYAAADLTDCLERVSAPVLLIAGSTDAIAPPSRVRDTYHLLTAAGVKARYYELQSDGGHATLLSDAGRLKAPITDFLSRV